MRYVEPVFRPPSEANSYLLQATIGCSWNHCTYCAMYRTKQYDLRPLDDVLEDIAAARQAFGDEIRKVFVLDGDALAMPLGMWEPILEAISATLPQAPPGELLRDRPQPAGEDARRARPPARAGAQAALHRPRVRRRRHAEAHRQGRHRGGARRGGGQGPAPPA
jgi:hypothetical protein